MKPLVVHSNVYALTIVSGLLHVDQNDTLFFFLLVCFNYWYADLLLQFTKTYSTVDYVRIHVEYFLDDEVGPLLKHSCCI